MVEEAQFELTGGAVTIFGDDDHFDAMFVHHSAHSFAKPSILRDFGLLTSKNAGKIEVCMREFFKI